MNGKINYTKNEQKKKKETTKYSFVPLNALREPHDH